MNPDTINAFSADDLPIGELRADGVETNNGSGGLPESLALIGTASIDGATVAVEETPDSPTMERAEQLTVTHKFTMSWDAAREKLHNLRRGDLYWNDSAQDSDTWIFKILSVRISHVIGNTATLEIISEALNCDNPPDQFTVTAVELGVNILKHPRYFYVLRGYRGPEAPEVDSAAWKASILNQQVIRLLQDYFDNSNVNLRNTYIEWLYYSLSPNNDGTLDGTISDGIPVNAAAVTVTAPAGTNPRSFTPLTGTNCAKYAALEILQKYWLGIETPYIVGWQVTYSKYYWTPQFLHPGGVIDDPLETIDEQFTIAEYINEGSDYNTIFDKMAIYNPQAYSTNGKAGTVGEYNSISWLRKADTVTFERTFFRVDMTWIGAPIGHWDTDLFGGASPDAGIERCGFANIAPTRIPTMPTPPVPA